MNDDRFEKIKQAFEKQESIELPKHKIKRGEISFSPYGVFSVDEVLSSIGLTLKQTTDFKEMCQDQYTDPRDFLGVLVKEKIKEHKASQDHDNLKKPTAP